AFYFDGEYGREQAYPAFWQAQAVGENIFLPGRSCHRNQFHQWQLRPLCWHNGGANPWSFPRALHYLPLLCLGDLKSTLLHSPPHSSLFLSLLFISMGSMDENKHIQLFGKLKLLVKIFFFQVGHVIVTNFTNGNYALFVGITGEQIHGLFRELFIICLFCV